MIEIEHPRMDLAIPITADSQEDLNKFREWKIQRKSNYSRPFQERTLEELQREFPYGRATEEGFVVDRTNSDGEPIRSVYDARGHEVDRAFYKPNVTPEMAPHDPFYKRILSEYDTDGYLVGVVFLRAIGPMSGRPGGFVRRIGYETINYRGKSIRVPSRITDKLVHQNPYDPSLRKRGWEISYKPPLTVDLTDVPYVPPQATVMDV